MTFPSKDITGNRYGRLVALKFSHHGGKSGYVRYWRCRCDCGSEITASIGHLNDGHINSCGCYRKEFTTQLSMTHGLAKTKEHNIWVDMKKRCYAKNCSSYKNYGGRGIYVCAEWRNDFPAFLRDMGKCPAGKTLDRIDNDGPYSQENCRWATRTEQSRNKRTTRFVVIDGVKISLGELSEKSGIHYDILRQRIDRDNVPMDQITKPLRVFTN